MQRRVKNLDVARPFEGLRSSDFQESFVDFVGDDFDAAVAETAAKTPLLVVTRSEKGAIAVQDGTRTAVAAEPIEQIVDATGAGDQFAAGFLVGQAEGRSIEDSLTMGAVCAAEVIQHYGPRPEHDMKALINERLG